MIIPLWAADYHSAILKRLPAVFFALQASFLPLAYLALLLILHCSICIPQQLAEAPIGDTMQLSFKGQLSSASQLSSAQPQQGAERIAYAALQVMLLCIIPATSCHTHLYT